MTTTITPPEWLTVGAKVAVVSYWAGTSRAEMKPVERLTATTVVVGGDRYRLDRLQRSAGAYGPTHYLKDPADPEVVAIRRRTAAERAANRAEEALRKWHRDKFDPAQAAAVREALAALAPYLAEDQS